MKKIHLLLVLFVGITLLSACKKDGNKTQFGIFKALEDGQTVEMDGTISSSTLKDFNKLEEAFPNINTINIVNCDGSSDDEINLQVAAKVHQKGMSTHINDNGDIASGGVDFFLAGVQRTKGTNTRIGVHSWSGGGNEATDFPVGAPEHQSYICLLYTSPSPRDS